MKQINWEKVKAEVKEKAPFIFMGTVMLGCVTCGYILGGSYKRACKTVVNNMENGIFVNAGTMRDSGERLMRMGFQKGGSRHGVYEYFDKNDLVPIVERINEFINEVE